MSVTQALLTRIIDYAGLFPPAALGMEAAVQNYQSYLAGEDAWMLGNLILPAHRLAEFSQAFDRVCCTEQEEPWTLSAVCAGDHPEDVRRVEEFQEGAVFIGSLEAKATDLASAQAVLRNLPPERTRYLEFPPQQADTLLPLLSAKRVRAKLRAGGLTPNSVPSVEAVAQFLLACAREGVPWKATAGLHHAVRGVRPPSDQPGSPQVPQHGFMNLFLAGALAWFGADESAVLGTLEEQDSAAFQIYDDVIRWHDHSLTTEQIEHGRANFAIAFGSCSFTQPVEDLRGLGWL